MRKHKISIGKVQEAFNAAIKRRDGRCMIRAEYLWKPVYDEYRRIEYRLRPLGLFD